MTSKQRQLSSKTDQINAVFFSCLLYELFVQIAHFLGKSDKKINKHVPVKKKRYRKENLQSFK